MGNDGGGFFRRDEPDAAVVIRQLGNNGGGFFHSRDPEAAAAMREMLGGLQPDVRDGAAVWVCLETDRVISPIGALTMPS
jgi:hypothetical protein